MRGAPIASPSFCARLALWAIRLYQRYLSPLKGFSCAYRVHRGGASCSAYGYRVIGRRGLLAGLRLLNRRLDRCGEVSRSRVEAANPLLHHQRGECGVLDVCDCATDSSWGCDHCMDCRDIWRRRRDRGKHRPLRR